MKTMTPKRWTWLADQRTVRTMMSFGIPRMIFFALSMSPSVNSEITQARRSSHPVTATISFTFSRSIRSFLELGLDGAGHQFGIVGHLLVVDDDEIVLDLEVLVGSQRILRRGSFPRTALRPR